MWDLIVSVPDHCLSFYYAFSQILYTWIGIGWERPRQPPWSCNNGRKYWHFYKNVIYSRHSELPVTWFRAFISVFWDAYEPRHEKTCLCHMRTTKAQISLRIRAVWSAPLFSLPRQYNISSFYIRNFKPYASLCSWAGRFESYLVANSRRQVFPWRGSYYYIDIEK